MAELWLDGRALPLTGAPPPDVYARVVFDLARRWRAAAPYFELTTSGSTGPPHPIRLTRAQLLASIEQTRAALGLRAGLRAFSGLDVRYVGGLMMLLRALEIGMPLRLRTPEGNPLRDEPTDFDFAAFVPYQLEKALAETPERLTDAGRAAGILLGGAPVGAALEAAVQALAAPVYATYGMTETASHVALRRLNSPAAPDHFVALPGVALRTDSRDCLQIRGATTAHAWLTTNDRVELLDPARFRWLGRADRVINSGGVKAQAEAVERAVAPLLPGAPRFFVTATPDDALGEAVTLVLEGHYDAGALAALRDRLRTALPGYTAPRRVLSLPRFPETGSGKVDRRAALSTFIAGFE